MLLFTNIAIWSQCWIVVRKTLFWVKRIKLKFFVSIFKFWIYQSLFDHVQLRPKSFFLTKTTIFFVFDMLARFFHYIYNKNNNFDQNLWDLAKVWISIPKRHGAGNNWEAV